MTDCMIACRSVTYAQKYTKLLKRHHYSAYMVRLPAGLAGTGCGHAVRVPERQVHEALSFLRENGAESLRIFCINEFGEYQERAL